MGDFVFQIVFTAIIALFFTFGMPFAKKNWSYGGKTYSASETRANGRLIFVVLFVVMNVLLAIGNNN
jgi:hypothetical protein